MQCGPRGLRGAGDHLYHNNGDGTFTDVSKATGVTIRAVTTGFPSSGQTSTIPDAPTFTSPTTPRQIFSIRTMAAGSSPRSDWNPARRSARTVPSKGRWESLSAIIAIQDCRRLYVTNFADEYNTLYFNQGKYDFRDVSYESGVALASLPWVKWGTAFVDLDNDGWLDLIAVNGQVYPQVDLQPSGRVTASPRICT